MSKVDVIRPYVEKLLAQFCGTEAVAIDSNGDVPIRRGSAMYWVSLFEVDDEPHLRVFAPVLRKVERSPELFEALNDVNRRIHYGRMWWDDGQITVSTELLAASLDRDELEKACNAIGGIADFYDDDLQARVGGDRFFADDGANDAVIDVRGDAGGDEGAGGDEIDV